MDVLLKEVLLSLKHEPSQWSFTEYEATNARTGVIIWIANSWYATQVKFPGGYQLPEGEKVSTASSFFGWATWRGRIMRKCRRIQRERWLVDRENLRAAAAEALAA